MNEPDLTETWLWRHAFVEPRADSSAQERGFFRTQLLEMRDRAAHLVSHIRADMPWITDHDITHLDALWDTASVVAEGAVDVNPPEAFVFGGAVLLHDAAMTVAAYPGGLDELKVTTEWQDTFARLASERHDGTSEAQPEAVSDQEVAAIVLRRLHASRAESLAEQAWETADRNPIHLIDNQELRLFYSQAIGRVAHSHWWPVPRVETEFAEDLGPLAGRTRNKVDVVKIACLLRIADALHLDSRRAPRFLRAIARPEGLSADHWGFQERLSRPRVEHDAIVFTSGQAFEREDADAWWLAHDTLNLVDRELRDVDVLLQSTNRDRLNARRVKGADSPQKLSSTLRTRGWQPVDTTVRISDVPGLVETLGGTRLYGDTPRVGLRELIQNATDAVRARRLLEKRETDWGRITVDLFEREGNTWLAVEDNGVGMSEQVLTGPLLDFGTSFWRSTLAMEEFPGLVAAGMRSIGRFGIGFFSVFMLGPKVRVLSRRYDRGHDTARLLEFTGGFRKRPILSPSGDGPRDGGTRVEVLLKLDPSARDGLLQKPHGLYSLSRSLSLSQLAASVAPCLDVELVVATNGRRETVVLPNDWLQIPGQQLVERLAPGSADWRASSTDSQASLIREIRESNNTVSGRAWISPSSSLLDDPGGCVATSGLRAAPIWNVAGILLGEPITAARDKARPIASRDALSRWASEQAHLISRAVGDGEYQARSAEVVVQYGGDISPLCIVRLGSVWLTSDDFVAELAGIDELMVSFDGDFSYDGDWDVDVLPREFTDHFIQDPNIAVVLSPAFRPRRSGTSDSDSAEPPSVATVVTKLIGEAWGGDIEEASDERRVGVVLGSDIHREVSVFSKPHCPWP